MRILMLGWEYPPHISGGLGNACRGLARALVRQGLEVRFVMPRPAGATAGHDDGLDTVMIDPAAGAAAPEPGGEPVVEPLEPGDERRAAGSRAADEPPVIVAAAGQAGETATQAAVEVWRLAVESAWESVYPGSHMHVVEDPGKLQARPMPARQPVADGLAGDALLEKLTPTAGPRAADDGGVDVPEPLRRDAAVAAPTDADHAGPQLYPGDPIHGARAFAEAVLARMGDERFDVVHGNDWVTFPAALALARRWAVPCVLHVHSLEQDRSPAAPDGRIARLERESLALADGVIGVSRTTREQIIRTAQVEPSRVFVVYNGVEMQTVWQNLGLIHRDDDQRIGRSVLFLGRVTAQKGPEQFVRACALVNKKLPGCLFVMAGDGDLLPTCRETARLLGLENQMVFTGFLTAAQVQMTLRQADVIVVPSLSEPFGLVVLEAASQGVPAVVSEHAGVAEAMNHVVRCDPLDPTDIADKVLGVLRHPVMREELRLGARAELLRLSWDAGARRCLDVYRSVGGL